MVFFTCNACGQSIKKNRVEKHWQIECPRCEILSCMDCGKDFYGDEYSTHTSCITEAEKYQGALFKGEKGGQSKGERKQQEWVEKLRQSMASGKYSPRISRLLEMIAEYPNIPRKKSKFENFIKNSINVHDQPTMTTLWNIFNGDISAQQPTVVENPTAKDSREEQQPVTEQCTDGAENGHEKKKKQKKHTKDKEQAAMKIDPAKDEMACEPNSAANNVSRKTKKQKRKRTECDDDTSAQISEDSDVGKNMKHLTASQSNSGDDVPTGKRVHLDSGRKHKHKRKRNSTA